MPISEGYDFFKRDYDKIIHVTTCTIPECVGF